MVVLYVGIIGNGAKKDIGQVSAKRRAAVIALVCLASILVFHTTFAVWVDREIFGRAELADTSAKLLENKKIQGALSNYLVNLIYEHVNVKSGIKQVLPKKAGSLAGPAAVGLKDLLNQGARKAMQQPQLQSLWKKANLRAHKLLVRALEGGSNLLSTKNGVITLNLRPMVKGVAEQIGLADKLNQLPASEGRIRLFKSDQLKQAQKVAVAIKGITVTLFIFSLLAFAAALIVARTFRRKTLIASGVALVAAGVLVLISRSIGGDQVVSAVASTAQAREVGQAAWSISTSLLAGIAVATIVYGIIVIMAGLLAGPSSVAVLTRRFIAPLFRDYLPAVYAVFTLAVIVFLASGPQVTTNLLANLGFVLIALSGLEIYRRQAVTEFPSGPRGESLAAFKSHLYSANLPLLNGPEKRVTLLERLAKLRQEGLINEKEFEREKAKILASDG